MKIYDARYLSNSSEEGWVFVMHPALEKLVNALCKFSVTKKLVKKIFRLIAETAARHNRVGFALVEEVSEGGSCWFRDCSDWIR